jgi:hypothetical protein
MKKSINNTYLKQILTFVLTGFCSLSINIEKAVSAGGDTTQTVTTQDSSVTSTSPTIQNAGALTVTPTTLLQTGTNNFANVNSNVGVLNYPNCNGSCAFGILRTSPSNGINGTTGNQIEAVIGVIHSFNSPDQANADTNRQLVDIQKQRSESEIATNYIKAISDACQARDSIRAELSAKALGRIWNVDYKTLLRPSCG